MEGRRAKYGGIGFAAYVDTKPRRALLGLGWWEAVAVGIVAVALIWQWFFL